MWFNAIWDTTRTLTRSPTIDLEYNSLSKCSWNLGKTSTSSKFNLTWLLIQYCLVLSDRKWQIAKTSQRFICMAFTRIKKNYYLKENLQNVTTLGTHGHYFTGAMQDMPAHISGLANCVEKALF